MLDSLLNLFDTVLLLDTETTGISYKTEEIIELAAIAVYRDGRQKRMDSYIRLSPGRRIPDEIVSLTGITNELLDADGVSKREAAEEFAALFSGKTLVVAYNAQFDLCFLYYYLRNEGLDGVLQGAKFLDALTVYKDRRPYPHKLCNAIEAYSLVTQNTHRAIDDVQATLELMHAMECEEDDLERYINLFGYVQKWGVSGPRISSVRYLPQRYEGGKKLYASDV